MWRVLKDLSKTIAICLSGVLLAWLFFLPAISAEAAAQSQNQVTSITIPIGQWSLLKQKVAEQQIVLTELEEKLKTLKVPSDVLRTQLSQARSQLTKSQTELANAKTSLQEAESSIQTLQESLKVLRLQIDKERRVQKRVLWQNRMWSLLGGIGIGVLVK